ncbi:MAG: sugar ABC transporter substrate-binding protein [Lachnospiraceae bacterium]|nr:sugar ABC transporter substrate-binding protein [Lachnospiraceae bacterium]
MKKRMVALLTAVCMTGSAVGTGTLMCKAEGNSEKKVVTFYMWADGAEQEFDRAMVAQYEKEHPDVDIEENYIPYAEYLSKMNTMAAANSLPDIFNLPEGNVFEWGEKGAILDLAPLYEAAGINPSDVAIEPTIFSSDGHIWTVSYNCTTMLLYYNKELLRESGIEFPSLDASDPWTWEEFVNAAKKMTKDRKGNSPDDTDFDPDDIVVYGTMMPTDWARFIALLHTNGTGVLNEDGTEFGIGQEAGIEVIQSIADLGNKIHCAPSKAMAAGAFSDEPTMLMNGQVAMVIGGGWSLSDYTSEGFDVGVATIPAFRQAANISWATGLCMSPEAADRAEVFEFYQYFTNYNNSIQTAIDHDDVSLGGFPHTLAVFDGGENEEKWISTYSRLDATDICTAIKSILQADTTVLGDNVRVKNFPTIMDNMVVPALDNVWLNEMTAEEALTPLDLSDVIEGYWK